MQKQMDTYRGLLNEYCESVKDYKDIVEMSGLFLPNTLSKYSEAKTKYFYCGQDTFWWKDFDKMIEYYQNNNIDGYVKENNSWLSTNRIIEYSGNKSNFWTLIIRLHIYLNTNKIIDVNEINQDEIALLEEIGWGNINSIEIPKTLMNEDRWDELDKNIYLDIKEKSRVFDSLKFILDIYNPDFIFIFNWDDSKEEDVFRNLTTYWNKEEYIPGIMSTYTFDSYKTKLIWCPHPNNLRFKSKNINELIEIIGKVVK